MALGLGNPDGKAEFAVFDIGRSVFTSWPAIGFHLQVEI
jgi:hypothetical protein